MKRFITFTLMVCLITSILSMLTLTASAAVVDSGTCGDNLTWTLDDTGLLTISGTGPMDDYSFDAPWYLQRRSISKVVIETGVTNIGNYAIYGCENLTSVTIPNSVTIIGGHTFSSCTRLTSVTIPNSVTSIGDHAFRNCDSLTSVSIPNSITSIGSYAFCWCYNLASVTIPDSVTSIGDEVFDSCANLTSINVDSNNPNYSSINGVLFNKDATLLIQYPQGKKDTEYVIPNSVTSIGVDAFEDCDSLTSVTIPDSVTSIGTTAFDDCESLTSVTIPNSVTSIGRCAFRYCNSLTSVTIPNSITSISGCAFEYCTHLTSVTIPNSVTSIGDAAFYSCTRLTSVIIPDSVTSIDYQAFQYCDNLTDVYYEGSKLEWNQIAINAKNEELFNATIHFAEEEVSFTTNAKSGYYSEAEDSADKSGIIAYNTVVNNFDSYKDVVESFGFYLYLSGADESQRVSVVASNIEDLIANSGKFNTAVRNIPESEFATVIIAMPYVVIDGEIYSGNAVSATVDANNWLGAN